MGDKIEIENRMRFTLLFILLMVVSSQLILAGNFISTWDTTKTSSGSSNSTTINLPLEEGGEYDFTIYWGDGNVSSVTSWDGVGRNHTYSTTGS